jgi:hypothetical protein
VRAVARDPRLFDRLLAINMSQRFLSALGLGGAEHAEQDKCRRRGGLPTLLRAAHWSQIVSWLPATADFGLQLLSQVLCRPAKEPVRHLDFVMFLIRVPTETKLERPVADSYRVSVDGSKQFAASVRDDSNLGHKTLLPYFSRPLVS